MFRPVPGSVNTNDLLNIIQGTLPQPEINLTDIRTRMQTVGNAENQPYLKCID